MFWWEVRIPSRIGEPNIVLNLGLKVPGWFGFGIRNGTKFCSGNLILPKRKSDLMAFVIQNAEHCNTRTSSACSKLLKVSLMGLILY